MFAVKVSVAPVPKVPVPAPRLAAPVFWVTPATFTVSPSLTVFFALATHQVDGGVHEVPYHRLHISADVPDLGELRRLHL